MRTSNSLNLVIGTKIRIGKAYASSSQFKAGEIITLIKGDFFRYNGMEDVMEHAPAVWNYEENDFDSIYHLFGNDLENFMDCEIIEQGVQERSGE